MEHLNNGQVGALTLAHYSEVILYWVGGFIVKAFKFSIQIVDSLKGNGLLLLKCISIVLCMLALPVSTYFQALPISAQPFVHYWGCSIGKYHLVHMNCPLSGIQGLSAIQEQ